MSAGISSRRQTGGFEDPRRLIFTCRMESTCPLMSPSDREFSARTPSLRTVHATPDGQLDPTVTRPPGANAAETASTPWQHFGNVPTVQCVQPVQKTPQNG